MEPAGLKKRIHVRSFLLICISYTALFCTGCGKKPAESGDAARLSLCSDPTSLDPRQARDLDSVNVTRMLFEGLTRIGALGQAELGTACRVGRSEEGLRYTFHLRKARWSNGDFVTALDFERAWKAILDPQFATDIAYQLYPIKNARKAKLGEVPVDMVGVFAQDPQTLIVDLEAPVPHFLELVSMSSFFPVHSKIAAESASWHLNPQSFVSNGPFMLASWKHSDQIVLKKNPYFWEQEKVKLSGVELFIAPADTALRMYQDGGLDWAGSPLSSISPDACAGLKNQICSAPFLATYFYRLNTAETVGGKKNPLSDHNFRRALSLALDREAIVAHVLQGGQLPARSLVPPGMELNSEGYFFENQEAANCALNQCHWEGPIVISYLNNERNVAIAQAIQNQWKETLGIEVELEAVEPRVYYQRVSKKEFQIAAGSWSADFNDPITFLDVFKYRSGSTNNTEWENLAYIDLLDRSGLCKEKSERRALLREAETILMQEMPIIPIYHFALNYLKREGFEGVGLSLMGQLDLREAYFGEKQ